MARWAPAALIVIVLVGIAATANQQQSAHRMALVNVSVVMEQTPGYSEARDSFQLERQQYQNEVERLQAQLDSTIREYDQQQVVLSPTAREEKMAQIRQLQQRLSQRAQELQIRAQERERELVAPLEDRVQAVIEGLRAERNLSVIFDVSAPGSGIIAADRTLDLTATVVQRLRAQEQP